MASSPVRRTELLGALSLAIDLGTGQPQTWVIQSCLAGLRFAESLGLTQQERREVFDLSLLRHLGCTAAASRVAALFGSEMNLQGSFTLDSKDTLRALAYMIQAAGKGEPLPSRARRIANILAAGPGAKDEDDQAHCEVAVQLAHRMSVDAHTLDHLNQVYERWDGRGVPHGLKGEAIALPARVVQLAEAAVTVWLADGTDAGMDAVVRLLRAHAGRIHDPALVDAFCRIAPDLFTALDPPSLWDALLAAEPGEPDYLAGEQLDEALTAVADFADLKSPYFIGHSRRVADLAVRAAEAYGLPAPDVLKVRRAAWVHDVGRVAVSSAIWNKPGALNEAEWERVRLHPHYTARIFARSPALEPLGALAALHHERLDGTGYPRQWPAAMLSPASRVLAAANAYCAITEARPHRPAQTPDQAAAMLRSEAKVGRLDSDAVNAVLIVAGHKVERPRRVGDLTPRELEILRLIARGLTNRQMAQHLLLSEKTVGHHIERLYSKIEVGTRAGATLYAVQNNLLD
jgi:HD-GYP domain-containing protein (c-di-GMP phosphodiesterase class II)